jgi:hypothetical protein
MSSSGMSDSETASQNIQLVSLSAPGNYSTSTLYPILDIPPPTTLKTTQKEVVTYSKEVQTTTWIPEEDIEEDGEEAVNRRIEEEVQRELERLRLDEERAREEDLHRLEAEKEVPGTLITE